ncbi:MAG: hypothetical protein A2086_01530 [Spirochaetes bacterium GWD1_27_9]|nr:MAG: hypothetical protein A2Z98_08885 [Spirochaetes bacterium GWB1_27_13]OHD41756.1 MAG: hypothetical protein A2086_01530 [Spirochaetes bacterium GWD1_27_9]
MAAKYINPYTDFGFKKLFGEEGNKDLLIDFLNEILPEEHKIAELTFKPTEKLGNINSDRKAIYDIYCENKTGQKFIVEMQKAKLNFFKDRTVFYSTFPLQEQAEKGEWDYNLKPVYCIALLDFKFDNKNNNDYINKIQLKNQYCEVFYDKLTYIFIEMPLFNKKEDELTTHFEKWLYFLKKLEDFNEIPNILNEPIFKKGFEVAKIANFNSDEMFDYQQSLKIYRDLKGVIDTSFQDGVKLGIEKGEILKQQKTLIRLLSKKFGITEDEKQLIEKYFDGAKLDKALDEILFTDSKIKILDWLK